MEDNKKCTTIWLRPSVIRRMDAWLEESQNLLDWIEKTPAEKQAWMEQVS